MKVVVAIPAFNEENTIGEVVASIPRDIADKVEVVVIDDGSTDNTVSEAKKAGADKIVSHNQNLGLGWAFKRGLSEGIELGGDIIINIDADGQYVGEEIRKLVKPIMDGKADIVLGSRFAGKIEHMTYTKRVGNFIATKMTRFLSSAKITDAQTGFRAFSRDAAMRMNILSSYTYTQETIIQASHQGLSIREVPVTFKKRTSESRLISNVFLYAAKCGYAMLKTYLDYKPLRPFTFMGCLIILSGFISGLIGGLKYLIIGFSTNQIPYLIVSVILLIVGFQLIILGIVTDMVNSNRRILDEIIYNVRRRKA